MYLSILCVPVWWLVLCHTIAQGGFDTGGIARHRVQRFTLGPGMKSCQPFPSDKCYIYEGRGLKGWLLAFFLLFLRVRCLKATGLDVMGS
jgi:hypothetical protein